MMHVAVELVFDAASEERLRALWFSLQRFYGQPHRTELGVTPHISLTSFSNGEPEFLRTELGSFCERFAVFQLKLGSVRSFATAEGVVYLAPEESRELRAIHQAFHEALEERGAAGHPYYVPAVWIPHCTVATDVPADRIPEVVRKAQEFVVDDVVTVEAIAAVAYRPARELYRLPLSRGNVAV